MARPPGKALRNKRVTEADKEQFLEGLRQGMTFSQAAEAACHPAITFSWHRRRYPEFAEAVDQAREIGSDKIEAEALKRGIEGVLKPIIGKVEPGIDGHLRDADGNPLYEIVYSDRLLEVLLKGRKPEYKDKPTVDITNQTLNVSLEDRSAALDAVARVLESAGVTLEAAEGDTNGSGASYKELPEP